MLIVTVKDELGAINWGVKQVIAVDEVDSIKQLVPSEKLIEIELPSSRDLGKSEP